MSVENGVTPVENGVKNPAFEGDEVDLSDGPGENVRSKPRAEKLATIEENVSVWSSCHSKVFKSAIGLVVFLSWASTLQVRFGNSCLFNGKYSAGFTKKKKKSQRSKKKYSIIFLPLIL